LSAKLRKWWNTKGILPFHTSPKINFKNEAVFVTLEERRNSIISDRGGSAVAFPLKAVVG